MNTQNSKPERRLKSLVEKFSYEELMATCEKKGWEIPTLQDVEDLNSTRHDQFWVTDIPTDPEDLENHKRTYMRTAEEGEEWVANKRSMLPGVVIVTEKRCEWSVVQNTVSGEVVFRTSCGKVKSVPSGMVEEINYCFCCGEKAFGNIEAKKA